MAGSTRDTEATPPDLKSSASSPLSSLRRTASADVSATSSAAPPLGAAPAAEPMVRTPFTWGSGAAAEAQGGRCGDQPLGRGRFGLPATTGASGGIASQRDTRAWPFACGAALAATAAGCDAMHSRRGGGTGVPGGAISGPLVDATPMPATQELECLKISHSLH
jgi:hypothetical protein